MSADYSSGSFATATDLWAGGYNALPCPRSVELAGGSVRIDDNWSLVTDGDVDPAARDSLVAGLEEMMGRPLAGGGGDAGSIALSVRAGTVASNSAVGIARQGCRLEIGAQGVQVIGNAGAGVFYGVQTLLQLLRRSADGTKLELPLGVIEDWPECELRVIHYDTKHHQDRLETVKKMISRAASFKINAIAWEIEDKFAYQQHPAIGAPGAFTPDEMRDITVHALRHHVEIIPILQGPSHLAFVLKHEEFAHLREDPANNYMLCPSNDECFELLFSMSDELIAATPGCRYFFLGTDEPYFLGDGVDCGCRARRDAIGAGGMMAEFITRCNDYLSAKGRTVMCWGETPMTAEHVPLLPENIVNAIPQSMEMSRAYRQRGIPELLYCPTQGARPLFPEYYCDPGGRRRQVRRLDQFEEKVRRTALRDFKPLGSFVAAWDDCGLHLESFWLGWALGSAWGWNPLAPEKAEAVAQFCRAFHGPEAVRMPAVYRALDKLARFWTNSWDHVPSERGPSYQRRWHPRYDRTLALPRLPEPRSLDNHSFFKVRYADLLSRADGMREVLDRATDLLAENLGRASRNAYSLEVFLSLVAIFEDHLRLLEVLVGLEAKLDTAREDVGNVNFAGASDGLDAAVAAARSYVAGREAAFHRLAATWEKSRLPKGAVVDGRVFVHIQDDTKDHDADWTPDLGYLFKPSRDLNLAGWADDLEKIATQFRRDHPEQKGWAPGGGFEGDE